MFHWWHKQVSLFTREWIEIGSVGCVVFVKPSPSLRGSGLKFFRSDRRCSRSSLPLYEGVDWNQSWKHASHYCKGLPLYEGVDWNRYTCVICCCSVGLPLYEGVDWNFISQLDAQKEKKSPSLRGSGLKCPGDYLLEKDAKVSLFTREWIEIVRRARTLPWLTASPSLRGSGLK